jgi:hypothetical protein
LPDERNEARGGKDKADIDLRPFLRGEKDRDKGPEAGLYVGNEKDEPIKSAQAARGGCRWWLAPVRPLASGGRGFACDPVALLLTVAKAAYWVR